jgi:hypothetical protein
LPIFGLRSNSIVDVANLHFITEIFSVLSYLTKGIVGYDIKSVST